jgi:hypothetical protein
MPTGRFAAAPGGIPLQVKYRRKYRDRQHDQNPLAIPAFQMASVVKNDAKNRKNIKQCQ